MSIQRHHGHERPTLYVNRTDLHTPCPQGDSIPLFRCDKFIWDLWALAENTHLFGLRALLALLLLA